jgi:predicted HAD superfamily Cof-like phosphohydrolase
VPCCKKCNQAKSNMSTGDFLEWARTLCAKQFPRDFDSVTAFHRKFGLPARSEPGFLDDDAADFRVKFMEEELEEFRVALEEGDLPGAADALVDLNYVSLGTAVMMGLPWPELFAEVQRANMAKERAAPDGSDSARGSALDVVKPDGWRAPDIAGVLAEAGWFAVRARPEDFALSGGAIAGLRETGSFHGRWAIVEPPRQSEDGYGSWLFACPTCHVQWTRAARPDDAGAPTEACPHCKETEVRAGL